MSAPTSTPISESERIVELEKQLVLANLMIQLLQEKLRLQRIKKYGPGSEKLNSTQLELLELEPGVSRQEIRGSVEFDPSAPINRDYEARVPSMQKGACPLFAFLSFQSYLQVTS